MDSVTYEVKEMNGVLRCLTCGYEQPIGNIANYKYGNWPMHCGKQLDWISQNELDKEKAQAPIEPVRKLRKQNPYRDSTCQQMEKVYQFIKRFVKKNGFAPSYAEMAVGIGWSEAYGGNVHRQLIPTLIKEGFLERRAKGARMVYPTANPPRSHFYVRGKAK